MAAFSETLSSAEIERNVRPFDPQRDLASVADLVELCFAETLDSDGRDYLARMRLASRGSSLRRAAQGWTNPSMGGYVWVENGSIVGNISLIPYLLNSRRFYLIANVAVHPSYRRRGIARLLTERAIQYARNHIASAVWLHVREENQAALHLYESEGFVHRAARATWLGTPDFSLSKTLPGIHLVTPGSSYWRSISDWLRRTYPPELCWHLPFRLNNMRPGLTGAALRFFNSVNVRQWGIERDGCLAAAAAWQASGGRADLIWLASPEQQDNEAIRMLLEYARHHSPTRRNLVLDYPAHQYENAICSAGFVKQQTLVWMYLPFS